MSTSVSHSPSTGLGPLSVGASLAEHRFIFIGGLPRSGKTLLGSCLAEHPEISRLLNAGHEDEEGYDEGQFLQSVYRSHKAFGVVGTFGYHPDVRMDETHSLVTHENARRLFDAWAPHWDLSCPFLLETSPPNLLRMRFLQALFPETYFVCVLRHPLAASYETTKWRARRIDRLLDHWLFCYEQFERDRVHLRNVHVVKYEALAADPQAVLQGVYHFLGLGPVPVSQEVRSGENEKYFRRWLERPINRYNYGLIRKAVRAYCYLRYERRVNSFGYSLWNLRRF